MWLRGNSGSTHTQKVSGLIPSFTVQMSNPQTASEVTCECIGKMLQMVKSRKKKHYISANYLPKQKTDERLEEQKTVQNIRNSSQFTI